MFAKHPMSFCKARGTASSAQDCQYFHKPKHKLPKASSTLKINNISAIFIEIVNLKEIKKFLKKIWKFEIFFVCCNLNFSRF
jgi:hypothetical protein